jgi:hypothetical protein
MENRRENERLNPGDKVPEGFKKEHRKWCRAMIKEIM